MGVEAVTREPCGFCTGEDCWPCSFVTTKPCEHDVSERHGDQPCTWPEDD